MAETPNIKLHQWQPDDDFLREEFNQDFAKIDTAVESLNALMPRVPLKQYTTTVDAAQVDISLADISFEDYWSLEVYLTYNSTTAITAHLRFNGKAGSSDYKHRYSYDTSDSDSNYLAYVRLGKSSTYLTLDCAAGTVCGKYRVAGEYNGLAAAYMPVSKGVTLSNLTQMNLVGNSGVIPEGTQITIYGVRK